MQMTWKMRIACMTIAALFGAAPAVMAGQMWTDRTILTFSEPVMVPGKTLPAGRYVFELEDGDSSQHTVEIRDPNDSDRVVALAHAVPMKRTDTDGDVVLKFDPAAGMAPIAIKGWFAPGSKYGHQFIYPDDEARMIANRTKTMVLSMDLEGTDREAGVIHVLSPTGSRVAWRADAAVAREWDTWMRSRGAQTMSGDAEERRDATVPMAGAAGMAMRVDLDDLDEPRYAGAIVTVDGEVEDVFGPRLFAIDEAQGADEAREVLVYVPSHLAALIREDDKVTVTGTVIPFTRPLLEREWGWPGLEPRVDVDFVTRPILLASRLVGGDNDVALVISAPAPDMPVGTSGSTATMPLTGIDVIAGGGAELIGRRVTLDGLRVEGMAADGGFYVRSGDRRVLVLPIGADRTTARVGDMVGVEGVVLQMPEGMRTRVASDGRTNTDIYVYATRLDK